MPRRSDVLRVVVYFDDVPIVDVLGLPPGSQLPEVRTHILKDGKPFGGCALDLNAIEKRVLGELGGKHEGER